MDIEQGGVIALALGFLLGLKHATDADHVVAVSTLTAKYRNVWQGIWVGASWGLGHTLPLFIVGVAILVFKGTLLDRYDAIATTFEFGVGLMLMFLGVKVFWNIRQGQFHVHRHVHGDEQHLHIHGSHESQEHSPHKEARHSLLRPSKPTFRLTSFMVGMVHGLAGSAAVMLVLLPRIDSVWLGAGYLVLFGLGTILSMSVITIFLSVPFALSSGFGTVHRVVVGVAGAVSLVIGFALIAEISTGISVMPF
jgi:ABC-type nickel/cobalt efflux system permease component RcnA